MSKYIRLSWWVMFGFLMAVAGGLVGIWMGWNYWKLKKTDPTGQRWFIYDEGTRGLGKLMFFLGLAFVVINSVYLLLGDS